jgi:hypothetical protein
VEVDALVAAGKAAEAVTDCADHGQFLFFGSRIVSTVIVITTKTK